MARLNFVEPWPVVAVHTLWCRAFRPGKLSTEFAGQPAGFQRLRASDQRHPDAPIDDSVCCLIDEPLWRLAADAGVHGVIRLRANTLREHSGRISVGP